MSDKCVVNKSTMRDIADAIRTKGGATGSMLPSEMKGNILSIPTGGGDADIKYSLLTDNSVFDITTPIERGWEIIIQHQTLKMGTGQDSIATFGNAGQNLTNWNVKGIENAGKAKIHLYYDSTKGNTHAEAIYCDYDGTEQWARSADKYLFPTTTMTVDDGAFGLIRITAEGIWWGGILITEESFTERTSGKTESYRKAMESIMSEWGETGIALIASGASPRDRHKSVLLKVE